MCVLFLSLKLQICISYVCFFVIQPYLQYSQNLESGESYHNVCYSSHLPQCIVFFSPFSSLFQDWTQASAKREKHLQQRKLNQSNLFCIETSKLHSQTYT